MRPAAWRRNRRFCLGLMAAASLGCPSFVNPLVTGGDTGTGTTSADPSGGPTTTPATSTDSGSEATQTTQTVDTNTTGPSSTTDTTGSADTTDTGPDTGTSTGSSGSDGGSSSESGGSSSGTSGDGTSTGTTTTGTGSSSDGNESGSSTANTGTQCDGGAPLSMSVSANGMVNYTIDGANDPQLTVIRGCTYTFAVEAPGHPFLIKTVQGNGADNSYNDGVNNNGTAQGELTWTVADDAPDALFYNCEFHSQMTNTITVLDP